MKSEGHYLTTFQRKILLKSMQTELRHEYRRRITIMLMADAGESQAHICAAVKCSQETARYWILMAQMGNAHLWDERLIGRPKTINSKYIDRLRELINHSPREFGYSFKRWTAQWLTKHLKKELGIEVSDRHINRLLKDMGLSTRSKPAKAEQHADANLDDNNANIAIYDLQSCSKPSEFMVALSARTR